MDYINALHQVNLQMWELTYDHYLTQELLTPGWFGLIAFLVGLYYLWWKLVDKDRLMEIMLFGSFVTVMATIVDITATTMGIWQYNVRIFPIHPAPFPFNYTVIPIILMLAYQYGDSWRRYLTWSVVGSALFAFGTSLIERSGIISSFGWNPIYDFFTVVLIAVIARAAILWVSGVVQASQAGVSRSGASRRDRFSPLPQPASKPMPKPGIKGEGGEDQTD